MPVGGQEGYRISTLGGKAMTVDASAVRDLATKLRRLSNSWTQIAPWHAQFARFLISVLGDQDIKFITGTPGISINEVNRPGQVLVFTEDLLAIATIKHEAIGNPTASVVVRARSLLTAFSVSDPDLVLSADDVFEPRADGWPRTVPIRLTYSEIGEITLPVTGPPEEFPSGHQMESLAAFLPSLLDDIGRVR